MQGPTPSVPSPATRNHASRPRCPSCGRFARYDAYYARWWCDYDDRRVLPTPPPAPPALTESELRALWGDR